MTSISTSEREELAHAVRAVCERLAPEERIREVAYESGRKDQGFDAKLWAVLCQQVGITAIALPEMYGGAGLGASALGVVAHQLGRALAPVPLLASAVLATGLLVESDAPAQWFERLIDGERTATAVLTESGGMWDSRSVALQARRSGSAWRLAGAARHVLHGAAADFFVVVARADKDRALFVIERGAPGVRVTAERVLDGTRPMASIQFEDAEAERVSTPGETDELVDRVVNRTVSILAAEQVGALERVLEIATEYARTRQQFGRAIGSFQAIKHRCADMLVSLEMAKSASLAALDVSDGTADAELRWRASMAKAVCSEALREAAQGNVQIHGGIGFTWEGSAGLYLKRARTDEVLFGAPGQHWDRLTDVAGVS